MYFKKVKFFNLISILQLVIMIVLLLLVAIINYGLTENWYEPTVILIFLTGQILLFNYDMKRMWEISEMQNPDTYLTFSLSFTARILYIWIIQNQKIKKHKEYDKIESERNINN